MLRHYIRGFSSALLNWRFVLLVFAIGLLGGGVFMACSWLWLAAALDSSLATRTLLTSLDANVFIDLIAHRSESLSMFGLVAVILAAAGSLLWIWVNAAVLAAVSGLHDSMAASCRTGAANYLELLKLWAAAMTSYIVTGIVAYIGHRMLARSMAASPEEMMPYWIIAACLGAALAVWLIISTIHDHARIRCLGTGESGWRAGLWACGYVMSERKTMLLNLLLACTTAAAWAAYQLVATALPATSALGLSTSMVWAEAFMMLRSLLRVWSFAAATEMQASADLV